MGTRLAVFALGVALVGCGGDGGDSPTSPAAAIVNSITATGTNLGSRIVVTTCSGGCTNAVTVTYTVTFNQSIARAEIYSQLFDAAGRQCGFGITDPTNLVAGQATQFIENFFVLQCAGTFTTTALRATLFAPDPTDLPVAQRPGLFSNTFNGGWTFVTGTGADPTATPTPGPTPAPTPRPSPTPSPTPAPGGIPVCSGNRPTAPCGTATGQCNDGTYTCSSNRSGTCSSHGGLRCVYCPGPLC